MTSNFNEGRVTWSVLVTWSDLTRNVFLPKYAQWMSSQSRKVSATWLQPFGGEIRKTLGWASQAPPPPPGIGLKAILLFNISPAPAYISDLQLLTYNPWFHFTVYPRPRFQPALIHLRFCRRVQPTCGRFLNDRGDSSTRCRWGSDDLAWCWW